MTVITRKLGIVGKAFDPLSKRAYTYTAHQPDNSGAWKLGLVVKAFRADTQSEGDPIDTGLKLLRHLELLGFGVFEVDTSAAVKGE